MAFESHPYPPTKFFAAFLNSVQADFLCRILGAASHDENVTTLKSYLQKKPELRRAMCFQVRGCW